MKFHKKITPRFIPIKQKIKQNFIKKPKKIKSHEDNLLDKSVFAQSIKLHFKAQKNKKNFYIFYTRKKEFSFFSEKTIKKHTERKIHRSNNEKIYQKIRDFVKKEEDKQNSISPYYKFIKILKLFINKQESFAHYELMTFRNTLTSHEKIEILKKLKDIRPEYFEQSLKMIKKFEF